MTPPIILASRSPRRRALLTKLGFVFKVRPARIDERILLKKIVSPRMLAIRLAVEKGAAVKRELPRKMENAVILAADTVVVLNGKVLGKPRHTKEAEQMLKRLSGKKHRVITGVAVLSGRKVLTSAATTHVWFHSLTDAFIRRYVNSGEPLDKAGAYGIQGAGKKCVKKTMGDYFNVVGLPLATVCRLLQKTGVRLPKGIPSRGLKQNHADAHGSIQRILQKIHLSRRN